MKSLISVIYASRATPEFHEHEIPDLLKQARQSGLLGARDRQMGGRFPSALIEAAQKASGFSEPTELLTYALAKVAFEDNYGEALLSLEGTVPRGTFPEN